jgi:aryl-alcohol dehydrogenase-like predicted oxidoreductase
MEGLAAAPNIAHLRENLAAAELNLRDEAVAELDGIATVGGPAEEATRSE